MTIKVVFTGWDGAGEDTSLAATGTCCLAEELYSACGASNALDSSSSALRALWPPQSNRKHRRTNAQSARKHILTQCAPRIVYCGACALWPIDAMRHVAKKGKCDAAGQAVTIDAPLKAPATVSRDDGNQLTPSYTSICKCSRSTPGQTISNGTHQRAYLPGTLMCPVPDDSHKPRM